jgi:hypothetical protein
MNDSMSGFDPNTFLGATLTEANTRRPPIPGGLSFPGTLGTPVSRTTEGKKESNLGKVYTFVDIPVEVDLTTNPSVRDLVGQDKVNLRYSFSLDISSSGVLDMAPGKNNGLRQLREALNMNTQGQPFNLMMVPGRQLLCKIGNRPYQGEVYDEIDSIARLA